MFYYLVRGLVKFVLLFLGLKFEGIHNLPKKGAVIIVANHVSAWDPLLVAVDHPGQCISWLRLNYTKTRF